MDTTFKNSKAMVAGYVKWLEARYSKATVRNYRHYVRNFFKYLKYWHRKLKDVKEITPEIIAKYVDFVQAKSAKNRTVAKRQCFFAVKNFLKWLERDYSIHDNPLEDIQSPKPAGMPHRDIFTEKEIEALLAAPGHADKIAMRDRAILELLYSTAMKSGELIQLENEDINLEDDTVHVWETAHESRVLPIQDATDWLRDYRAIARPKFLNADKLPWLFLSRKGVQMDEASITRLIKKYAKKAGIVRNVSAQMMRNTRAAYLLFMKAPEDQVQTLLGHKSKKSMKPYVRLKAEILRQAILKFQPRLE